MGTIEKMLIGRMARAGMAAAFAMGMAMPSFGGEAQRSGAELMARTFEVMRPLKSARVETVSTTAFGDRSAQALNTFTFQLPDKARIDDGEGRMSVIANGDTLLMINHEEKQYFIQETGDAIGQLMADSPFLALVRGEPLIGALADAVWLGDETIEGHEAARVQIRPVHPLKAELGMILFIRLSDGVLLGNERSEAMGDEIYRQIAQARTVELNPDLDESLFSLAPPAGYAGYESEEQAPPQAAMIGGAIADFSFEPLAGGDAASLSDFKGSPVILDLWATWCGPCVAAMPFLEQAAEKGKEQGLKILCVSNEDHETVRAFVEGGEFDDILYFLDPEDRAKDLFDIEGIPTTFAIDAEGVTRGVEVGFGGPTRLVELIGALGIELELTASPVAGEASVMAQAIDGWLAGSRDSALSTLREAHNADPRNTDIGAELLVGLHALGHMDEASALANTLAAGAGDNPMSLNNLAYLLAELDLELPRAEEMARAALAASANNPSVQDTLGWILVKREKSAEAIPLLESASAESESGVVWHHLGRAYEAVGETSAARLAYRHAVSAGGAPPEARERLDALMQGE